MKQFIINQPAYQLTKNPNKTINKPIIGLYPNHRWSCDLIDLTYYAGFNRSRKYILTVIDFFSKYVFAIGLINRTPEAIIEGFETISTNQSQNIYPKILQCDNGGEFKNDVFKNFTRQNNIQLVFTLSHTPTSNGLIENFNKFLRKILKETYVRNNNLNWIDHLEDALYNRNHSKQMTIKNYPYLIWTPTRVALRNPARRRIRKDDILTPNETKQRVSENIKENVENKLERYRDNLLNRNDKVRLYLPTIDPALRETIKQGYKKKMIVSFSPAIFRIYRIKNNNQEFKKPEYYIEYANRNEVTPPIIYNKPFFIISYKKLKMMNKIY